ncbi:hypothetical protein VYU27_002128 [Nannochloropsis oceanica]
MFGIDGAWKSTLTRLILEAWENDGRLLPSSDNHSSNHNSSSSSSSSSSNNNNNNSGSSGTKGPQQSEGLREQEEHQQPYHPPPPHPLPLLGEWGTLLPLSSLYSMPFGKLSQGQEKLAVIARAMIIFD